MSTQPTTPKGFNNEADAQGQADRWAAVRNLNSMKNVLMLVIPYYVANGALKPFDASGIYDENQYRHQPFPVSDFEHEGFVTPMSQVEGSGTSGWQPDIRPKVDNDGNPIRQFSREEIMQLCQAEYELTTGQDKPFTKTLPNEVLVAGGINPPETPEGFGRPSPPPNVGSYSVIGYEPIGTTEVRNGITYKVVQAGFMQRWDPVA